MSFDVLIPTAFSSLEPFVEKWALPSEAERNRERRLSPMADLEAFYNTILPQMRAIISHLNAFALEEMPEPEKRLLDMAKSFMEVAIAVEMFKEPDETGAFPADQYRIQEADA